MTGRDYLERSIAEASAEINRLVGRYSDERAGKARRHWLAHFGQRERALSKIHARMVKQREAMIYGGPSSGRPMPRCMIEKLEATQ